MIYCNAPYFTQILCTIGSEVTSKENLVKSVFEAIQNRNLVKLKEILEQLPSKTKKEVLEAKNGSGDAALAYAIYPHVFNDEIVEYLIKQGADPNKMLHNQCFLLHIAILKDYLASAKALINNGADINVKNQGEEALEHMKLSNPLNGRNALHFAIQLYNEYKNTVEVHHEGKSEFDKKVEAGGLSKISGDYKAKLNEVKRIEESERKIFQTKKEGIEKEEDRQKRRKSIKTLRTDQEAMNEKFEQQKKEAENSYKLEVNNYEDLEKTAKKYDKYAAKAVEGIEFIKFLVNKGANLTAEDRAGKTSLSIAKKRSDNQELVEFLENAYASQGDKRETNKKSDSTSKHQPNNTQEQSMSFCSRKLAVISVAAITCSLALYFLAPLIMGSCREPVEKFLERMEKKGKDGLTQYERHFEKIKEFNEQYEQKLLLANYRSPTNELSYKPTIHKKHRLKYSKYINLRLNFLKEFDENPEVQKIAIEHSIRRVIGTNYGHKPTVALAKAQVIDKDGKLQETDEIVGINVAFHHENDRDSFAKLLDFKEYSYICHLQNKDRAVMEKLMPNKHTVFMSTDQANKFIKDTLQIKIDSVEQLGTRLVKS